MDPYHFLFKFLLIGDSSTGKSCILYRFIDDQYCPHTVGVEFGTRQVNVGGRDVKLQIWDTAGQERFRSVTRSYYRGACGALLVYDVTKRSSYNSIQQWLQDARTLAGPDTVLVLVGNKIDLGDDREVTYLEAAKFALVCEENDMLFLETSAKTGDNVEEAFLLTVRTVLSRIDSGRINVHGPSSGIQMGDPKAAAAEDAPRRRCC